MGGAPHRKEKLRKNETTTRQTPGMHFLPPPSPPTPDKDEGQEYARRRVQKPIGESTTLGCQRMNAVYAKYFSHT